jgi:hypothetical protein
MPNPPSVTVGNEVPSYMGICQVRQPMKL